MTQITKQPIITQRKCSGLVFTCDRVRFEVLIRRTERCGLVKIKPTESKADYRCHLRLRRSSENQNCWSRKFSEALRTSFLIGWFFRFCLRSHLIISNGVISGIGKLNSSDSSDSDSVELDSAYDSNTHLILNSASSLVKTSLYWSH